MADDRNARPQSTTTSVAPTVSTTPASNWLTPERVAHAEFRTGFRGLDATEVRAFLARVASELRSVLEREADLVARLEQAEARSTAIVAAPLDVKQVSELLGQETARVLETARAAAADIRAKAETDATEVREAAEAAAAALRAAAETVLAERTAEAEAAASELLAAANAEATRLTTTAAEEATGERQRALDDAERVRAEARALLEQAEADGNATREAARDEGRRMVAEARAVRERILTDMARRRNVARQQLERVRAARERLLDAIDEVRRNTAELHAGLSGSLVEAKLAGERGARTVDVDDIPSLRDLDAEVEMAKDAGLIDVTALATRDEDLSVVDTGEFAAVTASEAVLDRDTPAVADAGPGPSSGPTVGSTAADAGGEAQVFVTGAALAVDAVPAAGPDEPVPAAAPTPAETVESSTVESAAAESASVETATTEPGPGEPERVEAGSPEPEPVAGAVPEPVAAVPEPMAVAAAGPDDEGPGPDAEPGAGAVAGGSTAGTRPRPAKRARGAKRTDELFARLKAADDPLVSSGTTPAPIDSSSDEPTDAAAGEPAADVADPAGDEQTEVEADAEVEVDAGPVGADRVALHTRDALLAGTIRDLARQLKLALSDQQNQLLEAGRAGSGAPPLAAEVMVPPYVTAATEGLTEAFALGRRSVVPDDRAEADPRAVAEQATALAEAVVDNLRQRFGAGSDDDGLWTDTRVRSVYRELRSQRLGELVEFQVLAAYSAGQLAAAPGGCLARWVSDSCGPDCLDNALAGAVAFGEPFPTGHRAPPAFPGCRCALVVAAAD